MQFIVRKVKIVYDVRCPGDNSSQNYLKENQNRECLLRISSLLDGYSYKELKNQAKTLILILLKVLVYYTCNSGNSSIHLIHNYLLRITVHIPLTCFFNSV